MNHKNTIAIILSLVLGISVPMINISATEISDDEPVSTEQIIEVQDPVEESDSDTVDVSYNDSQPGFELEEEPGYVIYNGKKYATGYEESDTEIIVQNPSEEVTDAQIENLSALPSELPSKFVPTDLPPLKDQSPYGTCWAFGSIAMAEMNLIRKGINPNPDLSELHLVYFTNNHVNDPLGGTKNDVKHSAESEYPDFLNLGLNYGMAASTLAGWEGVAAEETAPYNTALIARENGLDDSIAYQDVAHLKNYYLFSLVNSRYNDGEYHFSTNTDSIQTAKEFIYEYGAVGISMYVNNAYAADTDGLIYSSEYNSYYDPSYDMRPGKHAVVLVGWDDNFSKDHFASAKKPEADGAWLVRNSWTTGSFEDNQDFSGYFWMSYYSKGIFGDADVFEMDTSDNYDNNYQYECADGFGGCTSLDGGSIQKGANVFTAHADGGELGENLEAISFFVSDPDINYTAEIYTNLKDQTDPESGSLDSTISGTTKYVGYYTIPLDNPIYLKPGESYSIVLTLTFNVKPEQATSPHIGSATWASKGQSFLYDNKEEKWYDSTATIYRMNLVIKAFTNNVDEPQSIEPTSIGFSNVPNTTLYLHASETYRVIADVQPKNATNRKIRWSSSNESIAQVDDIGNVKGVHVGEAVITATTESGNISHSFTVAVDNEFSLMINGEYNGITVGEARKLEAILTPEYKYTDSFTWTSSNPNSVSVDNEGVISGVSVGTSTVTVEFYGRSASIDIICNPENVEFHGKADGNSVVLLTWKKVSQVEKYKLSYYIEGETDSYQSLAEINAEAERDNYTFIDETYKNINEIKQIYYSVEYYIGDQQYGNAERVYVGPANKITYLIDKNGVDNSMNPSFYRFGEDKYLEWPTLKGYHCMGLFSDPEYTNRFDHISGNNEDLTIYIHFEPNMYDIDYDPNGDGSNYMGTDKVYYDAEFQLSKNKYVNDEMPFVGWNTMADGSGDFYEDQAIVKNLSDEHCGRVVLYAQWDKNRRFAKVEDEPRPLKGLVETEEPQILIITGTATGGTLKYKLGENGDYTTEAPTAIEAGTYVVYYKVFADEGYIDTEEKSITVTISPKKGDIVVPSYKVSFQSDDGIIHTERVLSGETVLNPPSTTKKDSVFIGWYRNDTGKLWSVSTPVVSDLTVVAGFMDKLSNKKSPLDPIIIPDENSMIYAIKGQQISLDQSKTWNTENNKIVSITKKGVIKASNPGKTRIYSNNGDQSESFTVYVSNPGISKNIYLTPGEQSYLNFYNMWVDDADLSDKFDVYWFSSNTDVVKIDSGKIYGIGKGTATVTAYINGKSYNCKAKVDDSNKISGYNSYLSLMPLQSVSLKRSGFSFKTAVWESELQMTPVNQKGKIAYYQDSIVQINMSGKLTAIGTGHETITGRDSKGNNITLEVIVNPPAPRIIHLNTGANKTVKFNYLKKTNGFMPGWIGSNEGTGSASILSSGKITGLSAGRITATCTFNPYNTAGFEYKTIIYVENPAPKTDDKLFAAKGTLNYTIDMAVGSTYVIEHPNVYQPVLYKSNKNNIVFVNESGVIEARSKGNATLTTKINGKKVTISVNVN